jgi:hypothetical protein
MEISKMIMPFVGKSRLEIVINLTETDLQNKPLSEIAFGALRMIGCFVLLKKIASVEIVGFLIC